MENEIYELLAKRQIDFAFMKAYKMLLECAYSEDKNRSERNLENNYNLILEFLKKKASNYELLFKDMVALSTYFEENSFINSSSFDADEEVEEYILNIISVIKSKRYNNKFVNNLGESLLDKDTYIRNSSDSNKILSVYYDIFFQIYREYNVNIYCDEVISELEEIFSEANELRIISEARNSVFEKVDISKNLENINSILIDELRKTIYEYYQFKEINNAINYFEDSLYTANKSPIEKNEDKETTFHNNIYMNLVGQDVIKSKKYLLFTENNSANERYDLLLLNTVSNDSIIVELKVNKNDKLDGNYIDQIRRYLENSEYKVSTFFKIPQTGYLIIYNLSETKSEVLINNIEDSENYKILYKNKYSMLFLDCKTNKKFLLRIIDSKNKKRVG